KQLGRVFACSQPLPDFCGRDVSRFEWQKVQCSTQCVQVLCQGGRGLQCCARPPGDSQVNKPKNILPGVPGAEVVQLVCPKNPIIGRACRKLTQCVYGVAGAAPMDFHRVDAQAFMLAYGKVKHGQPVLGT